MSSVRPPVRTHAAISSVDASGLSSRLRPDTFTYHFPSGYCNGDITIPPNSMVPSTDFMYIIAGMSTVSGSSTSTRTTVAPKVVIGTGRDSRPTALVADPVAITTRSAR